MALGVGIGYLLGRSHKMRLALMVAAAGAAGKVGSPEALLQRGLSASPELAKMTETIRGELVGAVKAAALSATSSRIDSLSDRIRNPRKALDDTEPPEDEEDEDLQDSATDQEPDEESEAPVRRTRRSASGGGAS
ncbi:hypothetical protein, partial [Lentzea terrae]|uniref:hypothetical protein n=1 Tax=Lentzea terrae TaxID=2200761 RepID=UPI0018E54774